MPRIFFLWFLHSGQGSLFSVAWKDTLVIKSFWFCKSIFSTSCLLWNRSTLQNNEWPPKLTHNSSKNMLSFVMPYVWHSKSKQTSLHILREVHLTSMPYTCKKCHCPLSRNMKQVTGQIICLESLTPFHKSSLFISKK